MLPAFQKNVLLCGVGVINRDFARCVCRWAFFARTNFLVSLKGIEGRITGTITDQTGGAIAEAAVTVADVARGVSRTLTTDDSGEYNAPNLLPGEYSVRAEAKTSRKSVTRENIVVEVGKELRVDLTMQPGDVSQTITISESVPMVRPPMQPWAER